MEYYKTKNNTYGHISGDILYKIDQNFYQWEKEPRYMIDATVVENYPDEFELFNSEWEKGESIFYLSPEGNIIEENFHPSIHSTLSSYGNSFKNKKSVEILKEHIETLLSDLEGSIVITKNDILPIISLIKTGEKSKALEKLTQYLN